MDLELAAGLQCGMDPGGGWTWDVGACSVGLGALCLKPAQCWDGLRGWMFISKDELRSSATSCKNRTLCLKPAQCWDSLRGWMFISKDELRSSATSCKNKTLCLKPAQCWDSLRGWTFISKDKLSSSATSCKNRTMPLSEIYGFIYLLILHNSLWLERTASHFN